VVEALGAPFVEVHLSDVEAREPHRRVSVLRDVAAGAVWGKGPEGYREALDLLAGAMADRAGEGTRG
jgi:3-dehydroquinate dehydratase II